MNKKLVSLAVAAAIAAPTAAMAEAVLYGKVHVSIDYQNVDNAIGTEYDTVDYAAYTGQPQGTTSFTELYSNQTDALNRNLASDAYLGDVEDQGAFVNITGSSVYVPVVDATGTISAMEVMPGQVFVGTTFEEQTFGLEGVEVEEFILVDSAGNPIRNKTGAEDFSGWGINGRPSSSGSTPRGFMNDAGRASRLGVKGSEDLGNGLKAIYQIEFGVDLADTNGSITSGNNNFTMRNSFLGLAGDWGTFLVGRHDTPLKISTGKLDLFSDTIADYNATIGFEDFRTDNTIAYISPSFGGLSFAGATIAPGGTSNGVGRNINADSISEAYSLALIYSNGPWYASAAYESISNEMFMDSAASQAGSAACLNADGTQTFTCNYVDDDYTKWRLGLGILDWNGFTLTAIYEQQDDLPGGQTREAAAFVDPDGNVTLASFDEIKNQSMYQIQAGYAFGNNMIKGMWGAVDRDNTKLFTQTRETQSLNNLRSDLSGDRSAWALGFDHSFSKRTKAYVVYTAVDDDRDGLPMYPGVQYSGFSLGMIHKF